MVCQLRYIQTFNLSLVPYLSQAVWHSCNTWILTSVGTTALLLNLCLYPTRKTNRIETLLLKQQLEVCLHRINRHCNCYFIWFSFRYYLYNFLLLCCICLHVVDFSVNFSCLSNKFASKSLASCEYTTCISFLVISCDTMIMTWWRRCHWYLHGSLPLQCLNMAGEREVAAKFTRGEGIVCVVVLTIAVSVWWLLVESEIESIFDRPMRVETGCSPVMDRMFFFGYWPMRGVKVWVNQSEGYRRWTLIGW